MGEWIYITLLSVLRFFQLLLHRSTIFSISFYLFTSLSAPSVPDVNIFSEVIGDAFALAIVGYAVSISLGKTFGLKHGYKVDSNQVNQYLHKLAINF